MDHKDQASQNYKRKGLRKRNEGQRIKREILGCFEIDLPWLHFLFFLLYPFGASLAQDNE